MWISKEFDLKVGHNIRSHGTCFVPHGHTYMCKFMLKDETNIWNKEMPMVIDYYHIKDMINNIFVTDHINLNAWLFNRIIKYNYKALLQDDDDFEIGNATTELFALFIWLEFRDQLLKICKCKKGNVPKFKIVLKESPTSEIVFDNDDFNNFKEYYYEFNNLDKYMSHDYSENPENFNSFEDIKNFLIDSGRIKDLIESSDLKDKISEDDIIKITEYGVHFKQGNNEVFLGWESEYEKEW